MIINIRSITLLLMAVVIGFTACKRTPYSFGDLKTPSNLILTAAVAGMDANNPTGDGSGNVLITGVASNALTYKIDFGDGTSQLIPSGTIKYKYANPGTSSYTITVNAIGTGGVMSTISQKITVFVAFKIPDNIATSLTNNASRTWVTDKDSPGHVGVGPASSFGPDWYAATPNSRSPCLYDDEITFSKDAGGNIFMSVDNKGQTFMIGAATAYYALNGGDNCYNINTIVPKQLKFMAASSGSTAANSTGIQFVVPGNGIINFATGGNTYEILSITDSNIHLRNIGIDGNAWYQILKTK